MMQETAPSAVSIASYGRSCRGERYSGDLAFIQEHGSEVFLAIVDAVGHGQSAHGVAMEVETILRSEYPDDLLALIQLLHQRLKGGPGAVMITGKLDTESLVFTFVQIGDSHGRIFGPRRRSLVGVAGMLGHAIRSPRVRTETLTADDTLVLCTDGVSERYDLNEIQGYWTIPTEALARRIVEQFGKDHDDATCLVVRFG